MRQDSKSAEKWDSLTPELQALIDDLITLETANPLAVYEAYPPNMGGMTPGQRAFHEDQSRKRLLKCANKVGKTYALSAEVWWNLTGTHPFRDDGIPEVNRGLYFIDDLDGAYAEDVCMCLHELEPPDILHPSCRYDEIKGYVIGQKRGILTKNGSRVLFRSSTQSERRGRGVKVDWMVWNEPPGRKHWGEMQRSLSMSMGPTIGALTPLGDLRWLQREIDEDPDTMVPGKNVHSIHTIELTLANCPHRTQADIDEQKAGVPGWEWEQRTKGAWESVSTERRLTAWTPDLILDESVGPQDGWFSSNDDQKASMVFVVLAADHGEKAGACAWALYLFQIIRVRGYGVIIKIRMFNEYVSQSDTTDEEDAIAVRSMVECVGLKLGDVDWAVGDVNSAGKSKAGRSLNEIMEGHFARLMRLHPLSPAFEVQRARKGSGSVDLGLKRLNQSMARRDWQVHPRCTRTIRAYAQWEGKEDDHEHLIDRDRYAITQIEHNLDHAV